MNKLLAMVVMAALLVSCGKDNEVNSAEQNPINQTAGINGLTTGQPISSTQFQQELSNMLRQSGGVQILEQKTVTRRRGNRSCTAVVTETSNARGSSYGYGYGYGTAQLYRCGRSQSSVDYRSGNCSDLGVQTRQGGGSFNQYAWTYNSRTFLGNYNGRRALVVLSNDFNGGFSDQFSSKTVITASIGYGTGCYY